MEFHENRAHAHTVDTRPFSGGLGTRLDDGTEGDFLTDVKSYYRQQYFEAIDLVVNSIKDRFDQPGYRIYRNLEQLLLKSCQNEDITAEFVLFTKMTSSLRFFEHSCLPLEWNFSEFRRRSMIK